MGDEDFDPVADAKKVMHPKKVLMVLTSVDKYPDDSSTGFYLEEAAVPCLRWEAAGWTIEMASATGTATVDPSSVEAATAAKDKASLDWLESHKDTLTNLSKLEDLAAAEEPVDYDVLYFAGGYGCMWDLPENEASKTIIKRLYEAGKIVRCRPPPR